MITISNKKIEESFQKKVITNISCIGVDTASRTGWCVVDTTDTECIFNYGFVDIKNQDKYFKYKQYIEIFQSLLKSHYKVIIEESFYGRNVKTFQMLSRLGGFVYAVAHLKGVEDKSFLLATSARKGVGIKGNLKKPLAHIEFKKKLGIDIDDEDIIDAVILALNGILE